MTLFLSVNAAWNIVNFRLGLATFLRDLGHQVVFLAPPDEYLSRLASEGWKCIPIPMDPRGKNPLKDLGLFFRYRKAMAGEANTSAGFLSFTIKPNIYGGLAAQSLGIPVIQNVAGLGTLFSRFQPSTLIASLLYKLALRKSRVVFFQNSDDKILFLKHRLVRDHQVQVLPGSGIDTDHFSFQPMPATKPIRFLLVGRLFKEKGVEDFVQAAKIVLQTHANVEFQILGFVDPSHPSSITYDQLSAWSSEGLITYLGSSQDVRSHMTESHCIVLPTWYREGTPRTLLEAGALGRPLITTEMPGCKDLVNPGVTGLFCEPQNPESLAHAMKQMLNLSSDQWITMGKAIRLHIETNYNQSLVFAAYQEAVHRLSLDSGGES
jgi:glycosyltransferase involved in cell wall biosynthesis